MPQASWAADAWGLGKHTGEPIVAASVSRYLAPAKLIAAASRESGFTEVVFYKSSY
jgi:hypothetical protein